MNVETAREYSLSKKAATEDMPFGDDFLTIRVMGKMFLCISFNTPDRITMKCDPDRSAGPLQWRGRCLAF